MPSATSSGRKVQPASLGQGCVGARGLAGAAIADVVIVAGQEAIARLAEGSAAPSAQALGSWLVGEQDVATLSPIARQGTIVLQPS